MPQGPSIHPHAQLRKVVLTLQILVVFREAPTHKIYLILPYASDCAASFAEILIIISRNGSKTEHSARLQSSRYLCELHSLPLLFLMPEFEIKIGIFLNKITPGRRPRKFFCPNFFQLWTQFYWTGPSSYGTVPILFKKIKPVPTWIFS